MTRASIAVAAVIGVLGSLAGRAAADESAALADTLVSPASGALIRLSEGDQRFVLAVAPAIEGYRLQAEISAPLDDTTRTATFLTRRGATPSFRGSLHLGYDSRYDTLGLTPDDQDLMRYCDANGIKPCLASAVADHKYCTAHGIHPCDAAGIKAHQQAARRDGQPLDRGERYWTLGLDLAYAYDRTKAYRDDVGSAMTSTFTAKDLQVGLAYVHHEPGGWVVSVRGGYERNDAVDIGEFQRCESLPSTSMSVTGQVCSKARYLREDPAPESSGYARVAGAYYADHSWLKEYLSEIELRANLENLTTDAAQLDLHLLLFVRSLDVSSSKIRIGVGTTISSALNAPVGADLISDYSLFGIAGTSF